MILGGIFHEVIVFNSFALIGILNSRPVGTLAYLQRNPSLAVLDYCAAPALACLIIYLRRTKDHRTASMARSSS